MNTFVKFTRVRKNGATVPTTIMAEDILAVEKSEHSDNTIIRTRLGVMPVKESVDAVLKAWAEARRA